MKHCVRFLSFVLVLALIMGFTAIPASAGSTTRYTMKIGDTKYLYTNSGGKAVQSAAWTTSDYRSVTITQQDSIRCQIEVVGPSTGSYVIIHCEYYYIEYFGGYPYMRSDYTDYYITVDKEECTVWLDFNDGSAVTQSRTVYVGGTYGNLPTPSTSGYTFNGWYTAEGTRVYSSTKVTKDYDHTLYAHWSPNQYTLTFDANGGTVSPTSKTVTYECAIGTMPEPVWEGHSFIGWFTKRDGGQQLFSYNPYPYVGNRTLYAHYSCNVHTEEILPAVEPTCTESGLTQGRKCSDCGLILTEQEEIPALEHDWITGSIGLWPTPDHSGDMRIICQRCGEFELQQFPPTSESPLVFRLYGENRWDTSRKVAREHTLLWYGCDAIIIASGNDFADALAGSYLSSWEYAPILLSWGRGSQYAHLDDENIAFIREHLEEDGTVYILGGTDAVPALYEEALKAYNVKRLAGTNRFETNLLILEEVGLYGSEEILVCTSTNFADSLSASATGKPILLVYNEGGRLLDSQRRFLEDCWDCRFTIIGGENAVSAKLAAELSQYGEVTRLAGSNRFETSVMVAERYFETPDKAILAYAWNYPDGLCGSSLADSLSAPLILTMDGYEAEAKAYIAEHNIGNSIVLGGNTLISDDTIRAIFSMDSEDIIWTK